MTYRVGDRVSKKGGDYRFDGTIVAAFPKLSGVMRLAVEDDRGVLHIYSEGNLAPAEEGLSDGDLRLLLSQLEGRYTHQTERLLTLLAELVRRSGA